jgi:transcriptional regulator with XRE-family HTH domain
LKVGDKIKAIRSKELNLTAKYIADKLDMTVRAYSNIENNVSDISFSKLEKISSIFQVPIEYIINYETNHSNSHNNFYNQNGDKFTNNINQGINNQQLIELFNKFIIALADFKNSK